MREKIRNYSIPLIAGVVIALIWANVDHASYEKVISTGVGGGELSLHWFVNDIFMCLFFAIAGIEIVNCLSKGGDLNPIRKAITPLMATVGGIVVPVAMFIVLNIAVGSPEYANGWGICTATDIALAWLAARILFGEGHPAISFLLLLAVADDALGLVIIAIFYPDPAHPVESVWLLMILAGMLSAALMRRLKVKSFLPYVLISGTLSWIGMHNAHLHPALALIFIVPFMRTEGSEHSEDIHGVDCSIGESPLHSFEAKLKPIVDYGLFFFGLTNAGVVFSSVSGLTGIVTVSLIAGKTLGIVGFTALAMAIGAGLPKGMKFRDVIQAGIIGGIGLTVALFISESAFQNPALQGAAKMGALFTSGVFLFAIASNIVRRIMMHKVPAQAVTARIGGNKL